MEKMPQCPQCQSDYVYSDGNNLLICPECGFEFTTQEHEAAQEAKIIRDVNGNPIDDGDTLTVTQDIKVDGSKVIKQGAKAKNIRILDVPINGHELECSIDGFGRIYIKAIYVKK